MSRLSIRWRLTLWYGAVLAAVLGVFGTSVFLFMSRGLRNRIDRELSDQMAVIEGQLAWSRPQVASQELAARHARHPAFDTQVTGSDGSIVMRSERIGQRGLPAASRPTTEAGGVYEDFHASDRERFRMLSRTVAAGDVPLQIQVATSLGENDRELSELMAMLIVAVPLAVACTLGG